MARDIDRRQFVRAAGLGGLAGLAGCTGGGGGGGGGGGTETAAADVNVGMVYATGGLDDGSFNDQAQQGLQQAKEDFPVASSRTQPSEVSQFKNYQQQFAQSTDPDYDLVCCIGFLQTDALKQTAKSFSDQQFMIVDSVVESDNVASYVFKEQEGSYLAGLLAGLVSTSTFTAGGGESGGNGNVGFVGGVEGSLIKKFEAGFLAGVDSLDSNIQTQSTYVGSFSDPQGGKEAALSMYNNDADVVYHASGNTGTGVFQAAQEQGKFAIGVDRRQSVTKSSYADVILGSMVKRVDTAVYNAIESVVEDAYEGGSVQTLGLANDGVSLEYGDQLGGEVAEDVKSQISSAREAIVNGDVTVPTDPSGV
ncbi:BMP family protein [Halobaculum sp. MBLA0147]|uniref:BMP family lipoprotein n=1 Tax=Halobaculum sp. MBLA0147 TaxID=3079934 RepID=UPI00352635D8